MGILYSTTQIRELEALSISEELDSESGLMEKAGQAAFDALQAHWPEAKTVAVCCGSGNNGGDGFVVARLAHQAGLSVALYTMCDIQELKGAAKNAAALAVKVGLQFTTYHPDLCFTADVIVDALLGTGLTGEVTGLYHDCVEAINASGAMILALDVPSGINSDTGWMLGTAVDADVTMTFIGLKRGLFTNKAAAYCGEVLCDDLQIPSEIFSKVEHAAKLLDWETVKPLLPRRAKDTFKGSYGHVLVIGGDYGMGGAVRMSAESAARVGAGLVTVATRPEHINIVSGARPEIMCHQVCTGDDLLPLLEKVTTVVIGPGLGKSEWAQSLLNTVLQTELPKVLDADALNLLSQHPIRHRHWCMTPHPGEAARLLGTNTQVVQQDRFKAALEIQQHYSGVIALKGVGTIIQGLDCLPYVCHAGNPGMATGGMGDVLSGMIGGFLAQGLSLQSAVETGVFIHSSAADLAAAACGERGLLATDLLNFLPQLVNPYMQLKP